MRHQLAAALSLAIGLGCWASTGQAAWARLHYVESGAAGALVYQLEGSASRTTTSYFGLNVAPAPAAPRPTHIVTFRHAYTGRMVSVPIAFPIGTPCLAYRTDGVVYDYGTYSITVRFIADGSVDVVYRSGPFRSL
jgi:hypothetical protein